MEKKKSILLVLLLLASNICYAQWDDCPFGLVNDTYPGECGRYIDTNNDGICDHSQEEPTTTNPATGSATTTTKAVAAQSIISTRYNVVLITASLFLLYLISFFLSKKGIISTVLHRKIWNLFLTASFIVTAVTAVLLVLRSDFKWGIPFLADLSFWHTEFGLAMIWIAAFHMLWHSRYYLSYIKKKS